MSIAARVARWYRQVELRAVTPWRYSALMASGVTAGLATGQWLAGTAHPISERFLPIGSLG